ncbi:MAG: alpha/beta fold hydrolase [Microthrixaceae bacterium]
MGDTVELGPARDGRRLGVRWFGRQPGPGVPVVLSCHGGLSCGLDAALGHDAAEQRGLAILAPDRPGVGASDPDPERATGDWTHDVAALLDALGVERTVGVVGWSLGGQYALAAARLGARVPAVAIVADGIPLQWPGARRHLHPVDRLLLRAAHLPEAVARRTFTVARLRKEPPRDATGRRKVGRVEQRTWGTADAAVLAGPRGRLVDAAVVAGTASLDGMIDEYRAWARPWGFEPGDVTVPVTVWQGDADKWMDPDLSRQLADALPDGSFRLVRGAGHLLLAGRWGQVLDDLLALD